MFPAAVKQYHCLIRDAPNVSGRLCGVADSRLLCHAMGSRATFTNDASSGVTAPDATRPETRRPEWIRTRPAPKARGVPRWDFGDNGLCNENVCLADSRPAATSDRQGCNVEGPAFDEYLPRWSNLLSRRLLGSDL